MASNKKYLSEIEQMGDTWSAKITRKVSRKERTLTKQQADFASAELAQAWADETLAELAGVQQSSNQAQGKKRKDIEEMKRQRSARRAIKTEQDKAAKLERDQSLATQQDLVADLDDEFGDEQD